MEVGKNTCKVVITLEFANGDEEYVIWEPELYGYLIKSQVDIPAMLADSVKNDFSTPPMSYHLELWENPHIQKIVSKIGSNEFIRNVCVGKKLFPIRSY